MKKLTFLFLMLVAFVTTSMAQVDTNKQYRLKDNATGQYLTAVNYDEHSTGANGGVGTSALVADNEAQIFVFEQSGSNYKIKTKTGYYLYAQQWNVDALASKSSEFKFTANGTAGYYMQVYNTNKSNAWYYVKNEAVGGTYYIFGDAAQGAAATWTFEEVVVAVESRTITVSANNDAWGTVSGGGTAEGAITITAAPAAGCKFIEWQLNGVAVSTQQNFIDETAGDKEYVAIFAELDPYDLMCKPTFNKSGNTSFVSAATVLADGETSTVDISALAIIGQQGSVKVGETYAGATFDLNLTYTVNWGDVTLFQIEEDQTSVIYGPYEGSWPSGNPISAMAAAGITVNGNTATFPITIPADAQIGDMIVIRSLVGGSTNACETGIAEGGYIDFIFTVANPPYIVTVASSDEAMGTVSPASAKVKDGEKVTITATPEAGYEFVNWTIDGEAGPNTNPWEVTVTENLDFIANFQIIPGTQTFNITVTSANETMGSVAASTLEVVDGNTVTLTATANDGYRFVNWTVAGEEVATTATYEATITAETAFVANFEAIPTYSVTVTLPDATQGAIQINGEAAQSSYTVYEGTAVEMTATPAYGYAFSKWIINGSEYGENPFSVPSINVDATVEVVFSRLSDEDVYALICKPEYSHSGNNNNTYVSVAEINGESIEVPALVTPSNGNGNAQEGSTTPIEVVAGEEFILDLTFVRNFGDVRLFQIEKGNTIAPVKTYGPYEGSWVESGNHPNPLDAMAAEGLTVDGFKASFPFTFSESLPIGDIAIIRVAIGDCTTPCALGISEGGYVDFIFKMVPAPIPTYAVTAEASPVEGGQVTISANEVEENETVTLTATANEGYEFVNWTVEGTEVSTSESFTSEAINAITTFVANFQVKEYTITYIVDGEEVGSEIYAYGATVTAMGTPVKEGYTFSGWSEIPTTMPANDVEVIGTFTIIPNLDVTTENKEEVADATYLNVTVANEKVWDVKENTIAADKVSVKVETNGVAPEVKIADGGQVTTILEVNRVVEKGKWALMSLPFAVDFANVTVDGAAAVIGSNIKVMVYDAAYRAANSIELWTKSGWKEFTGTAIAANQGFAVAINANNGDEQTVTFTAASQTYDGADKQISLSRYASTVNEGADADWNFYGNPTLAKAQKGTGYALYVYNAEDDSYDEYASSDVATYQPYAAWFVQSADDFNAMNFSAGVAGALAEADGVFGELQFSLNGEDEARVILVDEASEEYVRNEDALYFPAMNANLSQLYLVKGNIKMAVSEQPALTSMAMGYKATKAGEQTLTLTSIPDDVTVELVDNVTGDVTTMTLGDEYTFQSEAGTFNNRFTINATDLTGIAQATVDGDVKVVVNGDEIKVYGAEAGAEVSVIATNGQVVATAVAEEGVTTLNTSVNGVIIVKVANAAVKVVK